jgi:large subunit ribosomal protein L4
MPTVKLYNLAHKEVGQIDLSDKVFAAPENQHLFYEVVKMQLARRRSGTAYCKDKGVVSHSTRKLFKQKGTGRARRGSAKSPLLKGGGAAFGPKPRDFGYSVPKRVRKAALRSALSLRLRDEHLFVIDDMGVDWISTKKALATVGKFSETKLLVVDLENDHLNRSVRNVPGYKFLPAAGVNVYDVLYHDTVVLSKAAVSFLEGVLDHDR